MSEPTKSMRILCLGASLVAGFSSGGCVEHPFSHNLAKRLRETTTWLADTEIDTVVDGVPGDLVTRGTFLKRMQTQFTKTPRPIDWTVVLGATNDIGNFVSPERILDAFKQVWGIPLSHGSKVLALTVPAAAVDSSNPDLVARRNAVNDLIKGYQADGFHVFDLHDALPYDQAHAHYWDDPIHFTPDGYDFIGDKIAAALTEIIAADRT